MTEGRKRRGRPPNPEPTVVVVLRLNAVVYDNYAQCALAAKLPVNAVIKDVLLLHAPNGKADADEFPYARK